LGKPGRRPQDTEFVIGDEDENGVRSKRSREGIGLF
jgi:hypothetical protein